MVIRSFIGSLLLLFYLSGQAQIKQLSPNAQISLLTIGPGENLYDTFGHTAIHVQDTSRNLDLVFNYGAFDVETPNFYLKFARGKLRYRLAVSSYPDFYESYAQEQRWIQAQVLNLSTREKQEVFEFLVNNAQPQNSRYFYDFFYDNCATRPLDVLNTISDNTVRLNLDTIPLGKTHRDLIHDYVPLNTWGRLGIDIALGSVIDQEVPAKAYLFLPDYTMVAFAKAQLQTQTASKPLVSGIEDRFTPEKSAYYHNTFLLSPVFLLLLLGLWLLYKTHSDLKAKKHPYVLDKLLLFSTGMIGVLLFLLWTATDHSATAWNYNLLWAFPFNILAAFAFKKGRQKRWLQPYLKLLIILMTLLTVHWIIGVQIFALALIPILRRIDLQVHLYVENIREVRLLPPIKNNGTYGLENNTQIHKKIAMFNIIQVVLEFL